MSSREAEARKLERGLRGSAEKWFYGALVAKTLTLLVGVSALIFYPTATQPSIIILLLYVVAELASWRHNTVRNDWEYLQRQLDAHNSLGWRLDQRKLADLSIEYKRLLTHLPPVNIAYDEYFASPESNGPKRALDNTQQSAWFAKHIAKSTWILYVTVLVFLALAAIIGLLVTTASPTNYNTVSSFSKIVTASLTFVVSVNLIHYTRGYFRYTRCAASVENEIAAKLASGNYDLYEAIALMHEYHLCHAAAPMNPSLVWRWRRDDLNEQWRKYKS
ncbi:hypothetical protein [Thiohalomonas denitrificans]|uniref:Uncharacterized protein n=1 Tax=Thiohalomonas denitrificans TaxID=415747 RepID=A0A1G5QSG0_9GAMM|nr:hypothetical protein [Thiohalomonas denitrificans]SCZ64697.1 hypothetical protein SAMN03097708_02695 [Thiohalomonas denitrificans]